MSELRTERTVNDRRIRAIVCAPLATVALLSACSGHDTDTRLPHKLYGSVIDNPYRDIDGFKFAIDICTGGQAKPRLETNQSAAKKDAWIDGSVNTPDYSIVCDFSVQAVEDEQGKTLKPGELVELSFDDNANIRRISEVQ